MSLFEKLNQVAHVKEPISLTALKKSKKYKVLNARRVTTTYGDKIVLELENNILFLGARFNALSDEELEQANKQANEGKFFVHSNGKNGKVVNIEFSPS